MRFQEAARLTWQDIDLERGAVSLNVTKTNDPRAWALSPGVVAGLRAWRKIRERDGEQLGETDRIFVMPAWLELASGEPPCRFRAPPAGLASMVPAWSQRSGRARG